MSRRLARNAAGRLAPAAFLGLAALLALAAAEPARAKEPVASAGAAPAEPVQVTTGDRPLRELAAQATAIVLGQVARTESYDEDRLLVHRLRTERVLRGQLGEPEPAIVDLRGSLPRTLLVPGERLIVLVRPAPPMSYLREHLPPGDRWEAVAGREGVVPVGSEAEVEAVTRALAEGAAVGSDRDAARRLAFFELASPSPRLVADALAELRKLDRLRPLSREEVDALGRALADRRVEPHVRIGLLRLLAERGGPESLPALAKAEADSPAVLEALLGARAALGGVKRADLAPHLASDDPAVRTAAVRALARVQDPAVVTDLERFATTDPDPDVRAAAIESLGTTKRPAAVPVLTRTFDARQPKLMQASARAMLEIGGPAVDDALVDLALRGETAEARRYAAFVLILAHGRDYPAVRRMEQSNPGPEVRDLIEHGLHVKD